MASADNDQGFPDFVLRLTNLVLDEPPAQLFQGPSRLHRLQELQPVEEPASSEERYSKMTQSTALVVRRLFQRRRDPSPAPRRVRVGSGIGLAGPTRFVYVTYPFVLRKRQFVLRPHFN